MGSHSNIDRPFGDDDLDDISVTLSQYEDNPDDLYELEEILAQHDEELDEDQASEYGKDRQTFYLIKWKGYHEWESSWIPETNFEQNKDDVLFKWQDTRMRQIEGHQPSFDLGAWEELVHEHKDPIYIRRKKRREKRRRLALPPGTDPDEDEYFIGIRPLDDGRNESDTPTREPTGADTKGNVREDVSSSDDSLPLVSSKHRKRAKKAPAAEDWDYQQPLRSASIHTGSSGGDTDDDVPLSFNRRKTTTETALTAAEKAVVEKKRKKQPAKAIGRSKSFNEGQRKKANNTSTTFATPVVPDGRPQKDASSKLASCRETGTRRNLVSSEDAATRTPATKPTPVDATQDSSQFSTSSQSRKARGQSILGAASFKYRPGSTQVPVRGVPQDHKGAGIFSNDGNAIVSTKRKRSTRDCGAGGQAFSWMMRNVVNTKSMRKDRPPEIPLEEQQVLGARPLPSLAKETAGRTIPGDAGGGTDQYRPESSKVGKEQFDNRDSNPISNELNQFTFQQRVDRSFIANDGRQDRDPDEGLITCWFWDRFGDCKSGLNCVFEHRPTRTVAFDSNHLTKTQATCPYWFKGNCHKDTYGCKFSHHQTPYVAGDRKNPLVQKFDVALNTRIQYDHSHEAAPDERVHSDHNQRSSRDNDMKDFERSASEERLDQVIRERFNGQDPLRRPSKHHLGCYFYNTYSCRNSAEACNFRHEILPWIANATKMPGMYKSALWNEKHFGPQPTKREDLIADARREEGSQTHPPPPASLDGPPPSPSFSSAPCKPPPPPPLRSPPNYPSISPTTDTMVLEPVNLRFKFGETRDLKSNFVGLCENSQLMFRAKVRRHAFPESSHLCLLEDAEKYCVAPSVKVLADGGIIAEKGFESLCESVEATLRAYSAAAVFFHPDFTLLVCCTGQSNWARLFNGRKQAHSGAKLSFYVCTPVDAAVKAPAGVSVETPAVLEAPPDPREPSNREPEKPNSIAKPAVEYNENTVPGLNYDRVFVWPNDGSPVESNIFLMFHKTHQEEMNGLTGFFSTRGARVYQSTVKGSWKYFVSKIRNGAIIFDPNFRAFDKIEELVHILSGQSLHFNLFRLANRGDPLISKAAATVHLTKQNLIRLFPSGQAVFIMDDCFEQQPHPTLSAVKALEKRVRNNFASVVLGRPGLLEWLSDLAREEQEQSENGNGGMSFSNQSQDPTRADLCNTMASLVYPTFSSFARSSGKNKDRSKDKERKSSTNGTSTFASPTYSSPVTPGYGNLNDSFQQRPTQQPKHQDKPDGASKRSTHPKPGKASIAFPTHSGVILPSSLPEYDRLLKEGKDVEACKVLAEWFADWALANVGRYRRFIILTMVSSIVVRKWSDRWKHVQCMAPATYVAEQEKGKGRGSKGTRGK
ncbi:MAG: hypothetical protein M1831_004914 [Alyxoria varia]|nr:MAG: hypothetical protein M1831_004914 [Alyxoria varia]